MSDYIDFQITLKSIIESNLDDPRILVDFITRFGLEEDNNPEQGIPLSQLMDSYNGTERADYLSQILSLFSISHTLRNDIGFTWTKHYESNNLTEYFDTTGQGWKKVYEHNKVVYFRDFLSGQIDINGYLPNGEQHSHISNNGNSWIKEFDSDGNQSLYADILGTYVRNVMHNGVDESVTLIQPSKINLEKHTESEVTREVGNGI